MSLNKYSNQNWIQSNWHAQRTHTKTNHIEINILYKNHKTKKSERTLNETKKKRRKTHNFAIKILGQMCDMMCVQSRALFIHWISVPFCYFVCCCCLFYFTFFFVIFIFSLRLCYKLVEVHRIRCTSSFPKTIFRAFYIFTMNPQQY